MVSHWLLRHPMVVLVGMLQEHFCWCTQCASKSCLGSPSLPRIHRKIKNYKGHHNKMNMQKNSKKKGSGVSRPLCTSTQEVCKKSPVHGVVLF